MGIFMVWPLTWSIFTGLIIETSLYVGLLLETSLKICMYMNIYDEYTCVQLLRTQCKYVYVRVTLGHMSVHVYICYMMLWGVWWICEYMMRCMFWRWDISALPLYYIWWWNNMGDCLMMMTVMKYMCVTLEHTTGTYKIYMY